MAAADILVVNEQAAALCMDMLWAGSQAGLAEHLAAMSVGTLVVTRGGRGALAWQHGLSVASAYRDILFFRAAMVTSLSSILNKRQSA